MDPRNSVLVDALERVFEEMEQAEQDYNTDLHTTGEPAPPYEYWYRWRAVYLMRRLFGL